MPKKSRPTTFTVTVRTENASFEKSLIDELREILDAAVMDLARGKTSGELRDSNGNTVGQYIHA